jgi:hypothetical protein
MGYIGSGLIRLGCWVRLLWVRLGQFAKKKY